MSFYSDDPIADFERHDAQKQKELDKRPRCIECDEPVQEEHYYSINDEVVCQDCLDNNHRKLVEDYVE